MKNWVQLVLPESRVENLRGRFRGRADLTARLSLAYGTEVSLAVETKVDSDGSRDQLKDTCAPPHFGVLLAVGLTSLKLERSDLSELEQWRVVGPADWAGLIQDVQADELAPYLAELEREEAEHAAARELAFQPAKPAPWLDETRRGDGQLEDLAWLAEVRCRLDRPDWWWTKTLLLSGPVMGHWPDDWNHGPTSSYLEFVCFNRSRMLCLKAGAPDPEQLRDMAERLGGIASNLDWSPPRRRAGSRARSCTAACLDMTELPPDIAAERTTAQLKALSATLTIHRTS